MSSRILKILGSPLLHFAMVGTLIYGFVPKDRPVLIVSNNDEIDDEVLLEEARRLGMLEDPVVAARLATLGAFVADHDCEDTQEAVEIARELTLDQRDVVVRRYLIQMMKLALAAESDRSHPTEADLEAHLRAHADRFRAPGKLELVQVFVSDRHGKEVWERAYALRDVLPDLDDSTGSVRGLGDPFSRPSRFMTSREEVGRVFGTAFASALDETQLQAWQGPIRSAHGVHWVWIQRRIEAQLPEVSQIRPRLLQHYRRIKREEHLERRLAGLRTRYEIVMRPDQG